MQYCSLKDWQSVFVFGSIREVARTKAGLGSGIRLTDFISLGVLGRFIPVELVRSVLGQLGRQSIRQRDLPAEALVYYIVALGFYGGVSCDEVLRCLSEGIEWVMGQGARDTACGQIGDLPGQAQIGLLGDGRTL